MPTEDVSFEQMVLGVAGSTIEQHGITVEAFDTPTGFGLRDTGSGIDLYLDNVTESAKRAGAEWRDVVTGWVGQYLVMRAENLREPSEDELRASIRTRLVRPDEVRTYAREFVDGLVVALAVDGATSVQLHTDKSLTKSPVAVDELYRLGQANTDAEPVEEVFQIEDDIYGITGDSFFIASKAANFPALLGTIGPAPLGVAFAPLNRSLVLYTIIKGAGAEWMGPVMALAQRVDSLVKDDEFEHPGGLLSDTIFYWAPDGRVEYLARQSMLVDGEPTITVLPGPAFAEYLMNAQDA